MKVLLPAIKYLFGSSFLVLLLACCSLSHAQSPLEKLVQESGASEINLAIESARVATDDYKAYVKDYVVFDYDLEVSRQVMSEQPETIELEIPSTKGNFKLKLVKQSIVSPDYKVESSSGTVVIDKQIGVHYRGVVKGEAGSIAGVSFFDGSVSILASTKTLGNFTVNKLEDNSRYISYFDRDLKVEGGFDCHTEEPENVPEFLQNQRLQKSVERGGEPCLRIHIEGDNDLFRNKGSVVATAAYIEAFFNQVAILFDVEDINTVISYIHVWDTQDPFVGASSAAIIDLFQLYILQGNTLNGDLGHLVSIDPGGLGGIARGIGVLCLSDDLRLSYSDINSGFLAVPTFSWTVQVFSHEMGHNLGSPHTHGCYWNNNNTQIDDCGNVGQQGPEGGPCFNTNSPIIPGPLEGGSVMSYCHLTFSGINLANGFGPQPGDLVRTLYNGASCLTECPIGSCGVPYQLEIENIGTDEATISWYHATENSFEVTYGYDGNFTTMTVTGTSVTLTDLDAGAKYELSVKTLCTNEESENVNDVFLTDCDAVFGLPYVELFDGDSWEEGSYLLDPCWSSVSSATGYGWSVERFGTGSANTGPSADHTSGFGKYVYAEASIGSSNDKAELISPPIDLGTTNDPFATYWYHMFGENITTLRVDVSIDNGVSWSNLETLTGAQQTSEEDDWKQSTLSLSSYEGEVIRLRFTSTRGVDLNGTVAFDGDIAIDDIIITDASLIDIAISNIISPSNDCGISSAEEVTVSVSNTGYQPLNSGTAIGLELKLNGSLVANETLTLTSALAPGSSTNYTFASTANLGAPGEYEVSVESSLGSDGIPGNNTRTKNVVNKSIVSTFPYIQSFETGSDWTSGGGENSWALGTPAKAIIAGASDGDNAWVTGGLGLNTYNANEASYIEGPCFNFTNLEDVKIEFDIWWEIETIWEGVTFQYSTDAGSTWLALGSANDPDWFNADTITTLPGMDGWSGTDDGDDTFNGSGGWVTVKHDLSQFDLNPQVFFRVLFISDPFVAFDGVGIDNIKITGTNTDPACYTDTINNTTCDPTLAGTDVEILQDVNDCDSVIITITELLASYDNVIEMKTCIPDAVGSVVMNEETYLGCDSITTIVTSLAPSYDDITVNETTCDPSEVGSTVDTLETFYGCDSIVTTETTLVFEQATLINQTSCAIADTGTFVEVLTASNGCDSTVTTVVEHAPIVADFSFVIANPSVTFTNGSSNAASYEWDFGDGNSSTNENPTNVYTTSGTYEVELIASASGCESDTATKVVADVVSSLGFISFIDEVNVYPNPSNGNFVIEINGQNSYRALTFSLLDVTGKLIEERGVAFNSYAKEVYQLDALSNGVYFLRIQSDDEVSTLKINILK